MLGWPKGYTIRSPRFKWRLIAYGSITSALFGAALVNALVSTLALNNPQFILSIAPKSAVAVSVANETEIANLSKPSAAVRAISAAKRALRQQSLATASVRQLAFVADFKGQTDQAERLMRLSEAISRRDVGMQFWQIESAVKSNDVVRALRYYDQTLRIYPATAQILYPILTLAAESEDIADPLAKIMVKRPTWRESFMTGLIASSPETALNLMMIMKANGFKEDSGLVKQLVEIASMQNRNAVAFTAYGQLRLQSAQPFSVKDPTFSNDDLFPPLDWQYSEPVGIELIHGSAGINGVKGLTIRSTKLEGAEVARQILNLGVGRYQLVAQLAGVSPRGNLTPNFELKCVNATEAILASVKAQAAKSETSFSVSSRDCSFQMLRIVLDPRSNDTEETVRIDAVVISPLR